MPGPELVTVVYTLPSRSAAPISTCPPTGVYLQAFDSRLLSIFSSLSMSAHMISPSSNSCSSTRMFFLSKSHV